MSAADDSADAAADADCRGGCDAGNAARRPRTDGSRRRRFRDRVAVAKTYKLFIGGAFPRSESGRTYQVTDGAAARFLANAAQGSRKDARDAVVAARKAFKGWSGTTAYNRGQVIYRIAEMLEGRRAQFVDLLGGRPATPPARWTRRSTAWCTTPAGPTSSPRSSAAPIPLPGRSSRSPSRSRPASSRPSRRSEDPLLGLVSVIAPIISSRQHRRGDRRRRPSRSPR